MADFLARIFIKDYKNISNPSVREKYGTLASIVGIIGNVILSTVKLLLGIFTFSVAIIADGLNNLSDAGNSIITLVSFKLSAKPADREHPFGHARIEYIASMIVSFLILVVGFETLTSSFGVIFGTSESNPPDFSPLSLIFIGASVFLKLWLAYFYNRMGKKINSDVILASSVDSLIDAISTVAVLVSAIIVDLTGFETLDAIVGLGVSVLILFAGIKTLNETKNSILGEAPVDELVDKMKAITEQYPEVIGIHDLMLHNYGPNCYIASFHAEVDGQEDIYLLHDAIDNLEKQIYNDLNIQCTVHMDPLVTNDEKITELKNLVRDTIKEQIYESISIHDFRAVVGVTHTNLIFDIVLPYEIKESPEKVVQRISDAVNAKRNDCFCVITVDRG